MFVHLTILYIHIYVHFNGVLLTIQPSDMLKVLIVLQAVMKAVLPNLDGLHVQVKAALDNAAESELRSDAMKVHEALLVRPCGACSIVAYSLLCSGEAH